VGIEVRKITATGDREGTVFSNPGGPGADARDLWYTALDRDDDSAIDEIRRTNDLVIVQPRGLEGAGALECLPEPGEGEGRLGVADLNDLAELCMDTDPEFVRSITTENVVRDHELVRQAMGLERISFLGYSYGTALGMMYQTLFPQSIERMVLDSSVGPTDTWWYEFHQRQAENRYQARNYVLAWIAEHDDTYRLGDTPLKVYRQIRELDLAAGAAATRFLPPPAQPGDDAPGSLPTGSSAEGSPAAGSVNSGSVDSGSADAANTGSVRAENAALASTGAFDQAPDGAAAYFQVLDIYSRSPSAWPEIAWVISETIHGTARDETTPEALEEQIEEETDRPVVTSDQATYLRILNCNETAPPATNLLAPALIGSSDSVGSTGEDVWALTEQTEYCPYPPSTVPPRIQANEMGAAPLILQSDHDPNTPGMFGPRTAEATGGTLVRIRGTVHCHFDTGNQAVDDLVVAYLRTGQAPSGLYLDTPRPTPGPAPSDGDG
jgi:pimeloyl-ACP methyl ester carboxylesterase